MVEQRAVTGVASGGLGTAANLEDTQLWALEDLRYPEDELPPEPEFAAVAAPHERPIVAPARVMAVAQPAQPAQSVQPTQPVQPGPSVAEQVVRNPRGQRRNGLIAAALVGLIALAGLLALRDGLPGGASLGSGDAAGAFPSVPPAASAAPATAAPAAGGGGATGGKGGGKGNGKGKGNH